MEFCDGEGVCWWNLQMSEREARPPTFAICSWIVCLQIIAVKIVTVIRMQRWTGTTSLRPNIATTGTSLGFPIRTTPSIQSPKLRLLSVSSHISPRSVDTVRRFFSWNSRLNMFRHIFQLLFSISRNRPIFRLPSFHDERIKSQATILVAFESREPQ